MLHLKLPKFVLADVNDVYCTYFDTTKSCCCLSLFCDCSLLQGIAVVVALVAVLIHDSVNIHHLREPSSVVAILDGLDREREPCRRSGRSFHVCEVVASCSDN